MPDNHNGADRREGRREWTYRNTLFSILLVQVTLPFITLFNIAGYGKLSPQCLAFALHWLIHQDNKWTRENIGFPLNSDKIKRLCTIENIYELCVMMRVAANYLEGISLRDHTLPFVLNLVMLNSLRKDLNPDWLIIQQPQPRDGDGQHVADEHENPALKKARHVYLRFTNLCSALLIFDVIMLCYTNAYKTPSLAL